MEADSGFADRKKLIPALIGAGICLFFPRSGIFSYFFLVPLGFVAQRYEWRTAWTALVIAVVGNFFLSLGTALAKGLVPGEIIWNFLYFTIMAIIFTWINAPLPGFSARLSAGKRFIIGSCLGAILFTGIFFRALASPAFSESVGELMNTMFSVYRSSGSDVVQDAVLSELTTEVVLDFMKSIMLRGGSFISCALLFFICRQISLLFVRVSTRDNSKTQNSLLAFHVSPAIIWILSVSLLLVVLTRLIKLEIPEILLWNVLMLCGILYLAQGLGVLQFFLAKYAASPLLRFLLLGLFVLLIFSPVVNAILLAGVVLLGIAENWVPFRAPKSDGPPSTPQAGDGD